MNTALLSFGLDILILFFLVFTIYYALKLSRSLNAFRAHKAEFQALISDLNMHIDKAQSAVIALKTASKHTSGDMQRQVEEAHALLLDLKKANETGSKLTQRIESMGGAKEGGSKTVARGPRRSSMPISFEDDQSHPAPGTSLPSGGDMDFVDTLDVVDRDLSISDSRSLSRGEADWPDPPSFFIRDHDRDDVDDTIETSDDDFVSDAERDLIRALESRRRHS